LDLELLDGVGGREAGLGELAGEGQLLVIVSVFLVDFLFYL